MPLKRLIKFAVYNLFTTSQLNTEFKFVTFGFFKYIITNNILYLLTQYFFGSLNWLEKTV